MSQDFSTPVEMTDLLQNLFQSIDLTFGRQIYDLILDLDDDSSCSLSYNIANDNLVVFVILRRSRRILKDPSLTLRMTKQLGFDLLNFYIIERLF